MHALKVVLQRKAMKMWTLLLCVGLFTTTLKAQKSNATKEQTIEYLNQKSREIVGFNKMGISKNVFLDKRTISEGRVRKTATGIELYVNYSTPDYSFYTATSFNPKHIVSITNTSKQAVANESPIGTLEIKLVGKTALFDNNGVASTTEKMTINFLQTDPGNETRIINALLHLKELYKAEDALFEN